MSTPSPRSIKQCLFPLSKPPIASFQDCAPVVPSHAVCLPVDAGSVFTALGAGGGSHGRATGVAAGAGSGTSDAGTSDGVQVSCCVLFASTMFRVQHACAVLLSQGSVLR